MPCSNRLGQKISCKFTRRIISRWPSRKWSGATVYSLGCLTSMKTSIISQACPQYSGKKKVEEMARLNMCNPIQPFYAFIWIKYRSLYWALPFNWELTSSWLEISVDKIEHLAWAQVNNWWTWKSDHVWKRNVSFIRVAADLRLSVRSWVKVIYLPALPSSFPP